MSLFKRKTNKAQGGRSKISGSASTDLIEIKHVVNHIIILRDNSLRSIIECSALNFDFKTQDEQEGLIQAFQGMLNSLDFPIQIQISSRHLNLDDYTKALGESVEKLNNELVRVQGREYIRFIQELARDYNVVTKRFYVVVPFYLGEVSSERLSLGKRIKGIFKSATTQGDLSDETLNEYMNQMNERLQLVASGISDIGLNTQIVGGDKLLDLIYKMYNPTL